MSQIHSKEANEGLVACRAELDQEIKDYEEQMRMYKAEPRFAPEYKYLPVMQDHLEDLYRQFALIDSQI